jgi:hypothetical protein
MLSRGDSGYYRLSWKRQDDSGAPGEFRREINPR